MARNEYPPETFENLADQLSEGVDMLRAIAGAMRESGLPHALIHGTTSQTHHMPAVLDWIGKAQAEVKSQIRAYLGGIPSTAELNKQRSARQKVAMAKKAPKKSPKRKP